jgi:hypothetical protein
VISNDWITGVNYMLSHKSQQDVTKNPMKYSNITQVQGDNNTFVLPPIPTSAPLINTLPSRNSYFQNRKDITDKISGKFKEQLNGKSDKRLVVLFGPGGIGKTSIAYAFADSLKMLVNIRIRAENADTIKRDFIQVARLLHIEVTKKPLEEIVDLVNQKLISDYKEGIIVFDNVASYKETFNVIRSENSGTALTRFFPKSRKFLILATTRNAEFWPAQSTLSVSAFDSTAAASLFITVSDRKDINHDTLISFLHEKLGNYPLAICQAASYLGRYKAVTLEKYISQFEEKKSIINALKEHHSLPPELTFDGETPTLRQAIFTTFDFNLEAIKKKNPLFLKILRHGALLHPDNITTEVLYDMCFEKIPHLKKDDLIKNFESAIRETSLMLIHEEPNEIIMHRVIQLVLLLRTGTKDIRKTILDLFTYFSENYLKNRVSLLNFRYILNNILNKKSFYNQVDLSNTEIIKGLHKVALQHFEENEIDRGIYFLSKAVSHVNSKKDPELYNELRQQFLHILNNEFELKNINKDWLRDVLKKIDSDFRNEVFDVFFEKEKELSSDLERYEKNSDYTRIIEYFSNLVIDLYKGISFKTKTDLQQLAKAHHNLGRLYRDNAAGIKSIIQKKQEFLEDLEDRKTRVRDKIADEIDDLEAEFSTNYFSAKEHLKTALKLRSCQELEREIQIPLLITMIHIIRLDMLKTISNDSEINVKNIVKKLIDNYGAVEEKYGNYYDDEFAYCKKLNLLNSRPKSGFFSQPSKRQKTKREQVEFSVTDAMTMTHQASKSAIPDLR